MQLKNETEQKKMQDLSQRCVKYNISHIILGILFWAPQACNFIKKETLAQVLSCEF